MILKVHGGHKLLISLLIVAPPDQSHSMKHESAHIHEN